MVDSIVMQSGRYKAYPEYKDSGFEWLGEIPSSWNTIPVGRLYHRNKRTGFSEKELLSVYRDYGVIPKSSRDDNNNKPSEDLSPYQLVKPDDLVMNKMKAWQGSIAISEYEGIVSPAYFVYEPERKMYEVALPRYVHYLLRNPMYITQYMSRSKGIRVNQWDLDPDQFQKIELLLPSKFEQSKIFEFLDYETAKIDTLIEKQQRLIELLTEKRQAVISHAVTKGLNPDVPMKYSGVEWLGEVPEHWEVKSLKYVARLRSLKTQPSATRYVGLENVESDTGKYLATEDLMPTGISNVFDKDNLLFGKLRPYLAKSWLATFSGICSSEFLVLESILVHPKYLNYLTLSNRFIDEVNSSTYGSKMPRASWDFISLMPIPTMDYDTSKDIAEFLDEELIKFDEVISKANQQIQLMQERRTALISAAVTGKIDVRDWVKPE